MSESEINQNSFDWFEWRKQGVGSSEVAAIMGCSPYLTARELWQAKVSGEEKLVSNFATERGHQLEPKARAIYEIDHTTEMPPALVEHETKPYLRASLDGWNKQAKKILEIKCPGQEVMTKARAGQIPDHYYAQIQYQLYLTQAQSCDYFCFDGEEGVCVEVKPDPKYQEDLLARVDSFWEMVLNKTPPPLSDRDVKEIEDIHVRADITLWKDKQRKIQKLEAEAKELRKKIIDKLDHTRSRACGVTITRVERQGTIDWAKATKGVDIDVEKFRRKGSVAYQFRVQDNEADGAG